MLIKSFSLIFLIAPVILARPQLISFKDGKIGVNWGGYHAEAGLGGFLTGNAAHGGLSASAGTPQGQIAGAGLGGNLNDGLSTGGLFAGASSGFGQGASAALGGNSAGSVASGGYGAEAHSGDASKRVLGVGHAANGQSAGVSIVETANPADNSIVGSTQLGTRFAEEVVSQPEVVTHTKTTYKKKVTTNAASPAFVEKTVVLTSGPHSGGHFVETRFDSTQQQQLPPPNSFDFGFYSGLGAAYSGAKVHGPPVVYYEQAAVPSQAVYVPQTYQTQATYGGGASAGAGAGTGGTLFDSIFNIPISTLTAVNHLLNGGVAAGGAGAGSYSGGAAVQSSVSHNVNASPASAAGGIAFTGTASRGGSIFDHIFNIPIATLNAVNQFLNGKSSSVSVQKTIVHS